ncbi:MAG TPA: PAS domain-containing protein [Candidatus Hydrogenedentes bacterium]|nr:PAS domain-containing protein [Candidatus Hydrogenedentota bacterium]
MSADADELEALLDAMPEGVFAIDRDGTIRRWNASMERLTGFEAAEALGKPCSLLRCDSCLSRPCPFDARACRLLAGEEVDPVETRVYRKDGTTVPVIKSARALKAADGTVAGVVETLTDLSRLGWHETPHPVRTQHEYGGLVGKSAAMLEVFRLITLAAASEVNVLISGETGVGKELVAKAIHELSERRAGPFVTVNCSALSESLLESELFGHARGAFTGAIRDYVGRFETANGGVIFLDEIGELSPVVQVKLLRILQQREFNRVGETTARPVDVRVVAATHRNLLERVREGAFREDLYYRLKVFSIPLPPLRQRKEDIPLLTDHFVERFNAETGKDILGLTQDAMRIVLDYCWPGNVRELENALAHAFVTCPGGHVGPFDLPVEIRRVEFKHMLCDEKRAGAPDGPQGPRSRSVHRERLLELLEACDWNKAEVARRLGIARTSVWRRMKKLKVPLEPPA